MRLGPDFSHEFLLERYFLALEKQNHFQIVEIFLLFSFAYFLDIMSPTVRCQIKVHKMAAIKNKYSSENESELTITQQLLKQPT